MPVSYDNPPYPARSYDSAAGSMQVYEGVRGRRIGAFCVDVVLLAGAAFLVPIVVAVLLGPLGWAAGFLGFGLFWLIIPPLMPFIAFFYNGLTVAGQRMGTYGMRWLGLEVRRIDGGRVTFLQAGLHAVLLYVSWTFPAVFLWTFFNQDKACLHDALAHVRVGRRLR